MRLLAALTIQIVSFMGYESDSGCLLQMKVASKQQDEEDCFAKNTNCGPVAETTPPEIAANIVIPPSETTAKRIRRSKRSKRSKRPKRFKKRRTPEQVEYHDEDEELSKCSWKRRGKLKMMKDCTNKDMFEFKLGVKDNFVKPTFGPDEYGEDPAWRIFSSEAEEEGWSGACVAYAKTAGQTCEHWCDKVQNMKCARGMDDAHHQIHELTDWLATKGYSADGKLGGCTILPSGHSRMSTANNGCNQSWATQICACAEK